MMKKKLLSLILALTLILSLAACGSTPANNTPANDGTTTTAPADTDNTASEVEELSLMWGITPPPSASDTISAKRMAENLKEKSGGKIVAEVYPGATLGGEDVMIESLLSGTIDMANVSPNVVATVVPEMNALCLPFLYKNHAAAIDSITDPEYTAKINEVLEPYGLHYLGVNYIVPRCITCNSELHTPADCKGEVIRVMAGPIYSDIYASWGLNTSVIAWGECYTAMQQHTVDGVDGGNESSIDMAFYEVAKYNIQTNHTYHAQMCLMSLEKWNSLNQATRDLITEVAAENTTWTGNYALENAEVETHDVENEPYNMINIYLTDAEREAWIDASQVVYDKYKPIIGEDFYNWITDFAAAKNAKHAENA